MSSERDNSEKLLEEIRQALVNCNNDLSAFKHRIANKHAVIFLGNTRSGKSTLVNYVMGTKLVAFEERAPIFKIKKYDEHAEGPTIGQGVQSCTSIPGVYPLNQLGMIIIDAPGFDDNRSEAQDIVNAIYINQIIYAKTVKFVLVSDMNDLTSDNIKGLLDLLQKVHKLIPDFETLKKSVSIIFTKDCCEYSQEDVALLLRQKILEVNELPFNKELVEYFVNNTDFIGIFQMPEHAGEVTNDIDINIENARVVSCAVILEEKNVKVVLSAKARLLLLKIYQKYLDSSYFEGQVMEIIRNFTNYFDIDDYVFASLNDELTDLQQNLNRIVNLFESEKTRDMTYLCEVRDSLIRIFPMNLLPQFARTLNVLVMIEDSSLMDDAIKTKFVTKYKESLEGLLKKVKGLITKVDSEMKSREDERKLLRNSTGVAGGAGAVTAGSEVLFRIFSNVGRFASPLGIVAMVGVAVTAIGVGVAGTSYAVIKEKQKKRRTIRERQGRIERMFEDD